jgi:membrane-bound lytic murein transglycosylase D
MKQGRNEPERDAARHGAEGQEETNGDARARARGARADEMSASPGADAPAGAGFDEQSGGEPAGEAEGGSKRSWSQRLAGRKGLAAAGVAVGSLGALAAGSTGTTAPAKSRTEEAPRAPEVSEKKAITWDLTVSDHERIDFFVDFLKGKNYDKTRVWLERIGKYGPLIQQELRARGMPEDLLYLTMIESGLDPNAYSRAHAAGLWQFIEETGERYGLEVSEYVDERRDPIKATEAALTYLQEMHERFDSWYLSAAGYNTGENRVGRIMREVTGSEKGADEAYWDIWDRLPRETRDYVPLMIAMGHIAKEPAKYGFHGVEPMSALEYEKVTVAGGTKLADVAAAGDVDPAVVEDLNPHLVKKQTPPGRKMEVRVPVGQSTVIAANLGGSPSGAGPTYLAE